MPRGRPRTALRPRFWRGKDLPAREDILEGANGFARAYADAAELGIVTEGLGSDYLLREVTVKGHACSARVQAAVEGILDLCRANRIDPDDVADVFVGIPAVILGRLTIPQPVDVQAAQMSLPHSAALAVAMAPAAEDGFALSVTDYERSLHDPHVKQIEALVRCEVDPRGRGGDHGGIGAGPRHHRPEGRDPALGLRGGAQRQPVAAVHPRRSRRALSPRADQTAGRKSLRRARRHRPRTSPISTRSRESPICWRSHRRASSRRDGRVRRFREPLLQHRTEPRWQPLISSSTGSRMSATPPRPPMRCCAKRS